MSPISRTQWKSVLINTLFAFVAAFVPIVVASDDITKAVLAGAATAGFMAAQKILQKALTTE
jgi:hypothetical protein